MDPYIPLFAIIGLSLGSFLNVLITRLPDPERTLTDPLFSACPKCNAPVRARDNIPVLSYLLLRGKCRDCNNKIGLLYPIIEIATAAIVTGSYLLYGPTLAGLTLASFLFLLLAVAATDLRTYLIPDLFTLGGGALGLSLALLSGGWPLFAQRGGDALVIALLLWGLGVVVGRVIRKKALGMGDVLLVGMMATFLGFGSAVVAIYAASASGLVFYTLHRRLNEDKLVPFGLHLAIGGAFVALLGETEYAMIIQSVLPWY